MADHRVPPNILFWKWSPRDLDEDALLGQVDDLCERAVFELVAVGLEHAGTSYDTDLVHGVVAAAAARLAEHGRRLVLSIDPRQEPGWAQRFPEHCLAWVDSVDLDLGADQRSWTSEMAMVNDHFGVHQAVRSDLLAAFSYDPNAPTAEPERIDSTVALPAGSGPGRLSVALPSAPGRRALVLVAHWLDYPDVFCERVFRRHEELLDRYRDVPLAGAAIDEWGTVPQPRFRFGRAWATPWWSQGLAESYEAATGRPLLPDLFRQQVGGGLDDPAQTAAVLDYYRVLRDRTVAFEELHYDATKARFGETAYVGFHNTWWAVDERNQACEVWKNGFSWWAVKRDVGQTDEVAPMGVRLALARKAGRPHFYNMWYSMGTHDVATFVQDAWRNIRYGGRTNHLGYRCEAERWAVLELADAGLEEISAMEERITTVAPAIRSLVDSSVLVVVGWEAAVDWRRHVGSDGMWRFSDDTITRGYAVLRALWDAGFIAELVPDYEHVPVHDGRVSWCGHCYDAAVYVDASPPDGARCAAAVADGPAAVAFVRDAGVRENDVPWGCRLEDGTVVVAAPGEPLDPIVIVDKQDGMPATSGQTPTSLRPTGNRIEVEVRVGGHNVAVDAEDVVVIAPDLSSVVSPALARVVVDGDDVTARYAPRS